MNTNRKILVIGASGMLGHMIAVYLRQREYFVDTMARSRKLDTDTILLDISDASQVLGFRWEAYDAIINCAAMLVKNSEKNKSDAVLVNAWFPHQLEQLLLHTQTRIIQISSDGIFSGKQAPYIETAPSDCTTFYGKTKFLGELCNHKDLTIRTSFVGPELFADGRSLFHWFVTQRGTVPGYSQTYFNGITSLAFAEFLHDILSDPISGILHIGASETVSKAHFLMLVKQIFHLDSVDIETISAGHTDHTLHTGILDSPFQAKGYEEMLMDLYQWMRQNFRLYSHYSFLGKGENRT